MTKIDIEQVDQRVVAMSERAHAQGILISQDPEFPELVKLLLEAEEDDLMVLLGSAIAENNNQPEWLDQELDSTND